VSLGDPTDYTVGDLDMDGYPSFRLPAGHAIIVNGDVLHRVTPVTAGERWLLTAFATM
jgi:predicted 2-oxoglutarate/Fe(II)-dependent dioxygenase YbiX